MLRTWPQACTIAATVANSQGRVPFLDFQWSDMTRLLSKAKSTYQPDHSCARRRHVSGYSLSQPCTPCRCTIPRHFLQRKHEGKRRAERERERERETGCERKGNICLRKRGRSRERRASAGAPARGPEYPPVRSRHCLFASKPLAGHTRCYR